MSLYDELGDEAERMLKHVEEGTTDYASSPMEVDASVYVDPEYFSAEIEHIFEKLPLLAALTIEMPKAGDYKAMELLGSPILITRAKDGSVSAMLNVCKHRGMPLVKDGYGNARVFTCPYHAWAYRNTGELQAVAEAPKFGKICKEDRTLTQLPCEEVAGIIWVGMTPGAEMDVKEHLGGMLEDLESYEFENWHFCGSRTIYGANWKIAYDGYLEGYHFQAAHPETIFTRTYSNIMSFAAMGPHMRVGFPQKSIQEDLAKIPREEWGKSETIGFDFIRTIFPNVSIFVAPEITQIAQLIPGDTIDKNTTNLLYIRRTPPKDDEDQVGIEGMMDWLRDVVDEEDYKVGLRIQKGIQSGALKNVIFGKNEKGNQYFHKYIDYYLSDDPNKVPPTF